MTGRLTALAFIGMCAAAMLMAVYDGGGSHTAATEIVTKTICHGHATKDGHWTMLPDTTSQEELLFAGRLAKQLSQIDPSGPHDPADVLSIIDQFACKGISREQTAANLIRMTTSIADLKKK
jgi:hypothetical protein